MHQVEYGATGTAIGGVCGGSVGAMVGGLVGMCKLFKVYNLFDSGT